MVVQLCMFVTAGSALSHLRNYVTFVPTLLAAHVIVVKIPLCLLQI